MYTKKQLEIGEGLKELVETVSYDNPPKKYITPETDEDPDDEEEASAAPPAAAPE